MPGFQIFVYDSLIAVGSCTSCCDVSYVLNVDRDVFPDANKLPDTNLPVSATGPVHRFL